MLKAFLVLSIVYFSGFANGYKFNKYLHRRIQNNHIDFKDSILYAKKKSTKLISDDLWASLDPEEDKSSVNTVGTITENVETANLKNKNKKAPKQLISSDLLSSFIETDSEAEDASKSNDKKKKKDKKGNKSSDEKEEIIISDPEVEDTEEATTEILAESSDLTVEQKIRKEKPSARVRFTESTQPGFVSMGLENVGLMYGNEVILKAVTFSVSTGERVGLVGPNGGGKSTSLKILAGDIEPTTGDILKSSANLRIAFLRQEFIDSIDLANTLKQELLTSFVEERQILADISKFEKEVEMTTDDPDKMEEVLNKLAKLQDQAISKGAYALESKVLKVMDSMGFAEEDGNALVSSFSGGWKMRIGLAKILLLDPNILFLDEPTNHMDLDSVIWLEDFLQKQNLPMLVVSHDREFLDKVCNKIVDIEEGVTVSYKGNYSNFLEQRKTRLEEWRDKYEKQSRFVKEEEKWIKKSKQDPNMSQQVKARETSLEKFKASEEWVEQPPRDRKFRFRFPPSPRCGEIVVDASKLTHGYGQGKYKVLFKDVDFQVERGDRIGFIGPNGSGKSTMMRIIGGFEEAQSGYSEYGSNNVVASYYAQNQADALNLELSILETVQHNANSEVSLTEIRTLLGQFMFKGDDVDKKIKVLSGGEKARVALCKLMLEPSNLLLLDEVNYIISYICYNLIYYNLRILYL